MACPICSQRKAKRHCPAKGEAICSLCCGREREVTIACPLGCPFLQEARVRESRSGEPGELPYKDVRIEDRFFDEHEDLVGALARLALTSALDTAGALDSDVRQALDALIKTQRTLEGGIHYETKPDSSYARALSDLVKAGIEAFRSGEQEQLGFARTTDSDVLKTLVFLLRLADDRDNGRPKGRAFLHLLARQFDLEKQAPASDAGGLIVSGR